MKRNEFAGEDKIERSKDPEIKPKQRWKALQKHDFGDGLVSYYIIVAFKDPMSKVWFCNYAWDGVNFMVNQSSNYVARLTAEEITKNFEFVQEVQPQVAPQINPNIWQIPADPFQGPIYRDTTGNPPLINYTFTTSDRTEPIFRDGLDDNFNFANNMISNPFR